MSKEFPQIQFHIIGTNALWNGTKLEDYLEDNALTNITYHGNRYRQLLWKGIKQLEPVLKTNDTWYGMTYNEDVAAVKDSFKKMLEDGVYKADLFADL